MFSLKGETDAPIPATSSSHTSEAPRCAMWCSVLLSSGYRRRARPSHGSTREEDRSRGQQVFLPGTQKALLFFPPFCFWWGVLCPRLPLSRAMASTDRSTGAREFIYVLYTSRALSLMWRTQCVPEIRRELDEQPCSASQPCFIVIAASASFWNGPNTGM